MTASWPWPADSPLDIARRCCAMYRAALAEAAPAEAAVLDEDLISAGQRWVAPAATTLDPDGVATARELEEELGISAGTIRSWAHRGQLDKIVRADGSTVYAVRAVIAREVQQRQRRAERARRADRRQERA